ncbi:MAG TPA: ABC transporter permease [Methylomirabilota bacterium]|jgi:putative spermidine/putrescine transport system permease protein|nr:ABC transporter permease [Methylomirabilota bacterium]
MARGRLAGIVVVALLLAFLTLPSLIVIAVSFNGTAIMAFPPTAVSTRWYAKALTYPQFQKAAVNSVIVTGLSTLLAVPVGTAAALALVRYPVAGRALWTAVLLSPLVVPGVAAGLGLLIVAAGLGVIASRWVLIVAHIIVVLPFVVRSVAVSIASLDPALERAAASLGARPARVFWRVTLPLLRPGLAAATLFAVIVSINEFVVSLFVSTRVTEILPVAMFTYVVNYTDPTMAALSALFIAATFAAVLAADRVIGLSRVFQLDGQR